MEGSCMCCGKPVDTAVRYVGIADLVLGISSGVVMLIHVNQIYDRDGNHVTDSPVYSEYPFTFPQIIRLPTWLCILIGVCSFIQAFMGIVLFVATYLKSRKICHFWFVITGFTCFFTGLPIRLYEMMVVQEFAHEVLVEQRKKQQAFRKRLIFLGQSSIEPADQLSSSVISMPPNETESDTPPPPYDVAVAIANATAGVNLNAQAISPKYPVVAKAPVRKARPKIRNGPKRASRWRPFFYDDVY